MLIKSDAIVISSIRFSESSKIVKILTRSNGMLSFFVKGVYSKNSSFKPSYFFPLTLVELDFYFYPNKNLLKIKELKPIIFNANLEWNSNVSPLLIIIAELINKSVKEIEKNEALFNFILTTIKYINDPNYTPKSNLLIFFLAHFNRYLGFSMQNNYSQRKYLFDLKSGNFVEEELSSSFCLNMDESKWLNLLLTKDFHDLNTLYIPSSGRINLIEKLITYYKIHVDNFHGLQSFDIYRKVFESG